MNFQGLENDFRKQNLSKLSLKMTSKMECFDQASFCFENRAQDAPKARQDAPRCHKTPQNSSKIPPRRPEDAPRCAQDGSKRLQDAPRRTQGAARHPQDVPRRLQDAILVGLGSQTGTKLATQEPPKPTFCSVFAQWEGCQSPPTRY